MGASGLFGEREYELLDGQLYEIMSTNGPHRSASRRVARALRAVFGEGFDVSQEAELPLAPRSQPRPDVLVLRGDLDQFDLRDEGPEDTALVIKVVDTREDTAVVKIGLYARAGIPEYWILDVNTRRLTVLRDPEDGEYRSTLVLDETKTVRPVEVGAGEIAVADLFPKLSG